MKSDKLEAQIDGQKMSKGQSTLDQTALMVPAIGIGVMLLLMTFFYLHYRRKQRRHNPAKQTKASRKLEQSDRSKRRRGPTLAESGGLPPARTPGKEVAS